jgi:hypothetical protein
MKKKQQMFHVKHILSNLKTKLKIYKDKNNKRTKERKKAK